MTFGVREPDRVDAVIVPWVALVFSVSVVVFESRYTAWAGPSLPTVTREYFACGLFWIAINALALVVQMAVRRMRPSYREGFWRKLDTWLGLLSVLTMLAGLVALGMPLAHMRPF